MTSSTNSVRPRLPVPTAAALILAGTGLFLFFAATNVQSGWLYALDALLWAVWHWDLVLAGRRLPEITMTRLVPLHVGAGTEMTVVLSVRSDRPLRGLEVQDAGLEPYTTKQRAPIPLGYIRDAAAHETVTLRGTFSAPTRGRYAFLAVTFVTHGPFGLFRRPQTRHLSAPLWVHPVIRPWDGMIDGHDAEGNTAGSSRRTGQAGIFAGVRPYRPGDSLRQIHWPITARRGELSVKELELPPMQRVTVVLDLTHTGAVTEAAVATAADLIADLWQREIPLTLVGPGRTWEPARWEEILEWLADLHAGDLPDRSADPGAVILISDSLPTASWAPSLAAVYAPEGASAGGVPVRALLPLT
ncbi:MAG: DUF58 domain-containing protein [Candidatus Sericytochromatia bacterium]|nr:DUF58 domain-containing protein [Candidatus Sericytochromatia bacterium]